MRIAFIGPPGSGKGTYSQMLVKKGWIHFSMGQAFRDYVKTNGKFAKKIDKIISGGNLVPPNYFSPVFDAAMKKVAKKIIFDGVPRTMAQARDMERILYARGTPLDAFLFLDVPEKELERRLGSRRQCEKCYTVYGTTIRPKKKGICDRDGEKLIRRTDDTPSVIRNRFEVYARQTFPVVDWASARFPVYYINGHGSPSVVFKRISRVISLVESGE